MSKRLHYNPGGSGRPKSKDPLIFKTIGLTQSQWDWLQKWFPTGSYTDCIRALVSRSTKFWPAGPFKFR